MQTPVVRDEIYVKCEEQTICLNITPAFFKAADYKAMELKWANRLITWKKLISQTYRTAFWPFTVSKRDAPS
jgi:hypothetical protein